MTEKCVVVYDLEYTAWEGSLERNWNGPNEDPEIIQIGAVKIRWVNRQWETIGEFSQYVKPKIRPYLSDYIKRITGISQREIDTAGVAFDTAIQQFRAFVPEHAVLCSNGNDYQILSVNCRIVGIDNPLDRYKSINVRPFFAEKFRVSENDEIIHSYRIGNKVSHREERAHDALSDASCVAEQLISMNWNI